MLIFQGVTQWVCEQKTVRKKLVPQGVMCFFFVMHICMGMWMIYAKHVLGWMVEDGHHQKLVDKVIQEK